MEMGRHEPPPALLYWYPENRGEGFVDDVVDSDLMEPPAVIM